MSLLHKLILPFASVILITGCTLPGSNLSLEEKNVVNANEQQLTQVEQINVYALSHSFVAGFRSHYAMEKAQPNDALDSEMALYEYRVGPGDVLNITIWDHPELTIPAGSYRSAESSGNWVHSDGKIFYPYIGFVQVADQTVVEIREKLTVLLSKYIENPQVDVNIAAFRSQKSYVTGEIKNPGQQPITNIPLTLLDAINNAGGLSADADWRHVTLTRKGDAENISLYQLMQKGDLTQNRLMQQGDIIHVPRNDSQKVFVLGDVKNPEMLKIDRSGMTLTEALSSVGGINELSADATGVFVVRSSARDAKNGPYLQTVRDKNRAANAAEQSPSVVANIYQLDISEASALVIGTEFKLEPYDIVYVTSAPIERYNRLIRQIMPTISAFNVLSEGALRIHNWN
ncbi:MAG: polysaccharide export outer membrane protein [Psychromonas sp.]|jgi:polysaccharide export outer membrane protein|uniref:polysaccharide export protein n=1 Tax=Psychromonas sp. TaxID=1884585 RepID=UPI0039E2C3D1